MSEHLSRLRERSAQPGEGSYSRIPARLVRYTANVPSQ